jgi:dihydropteroate synthase
VNDVSGFRWDRAMMKTLAGLKCGAVMMHMRGRPEEWRSLPRRSGHGAAHQARTKRRTQTAVRRHETDTLVLDPGLASARTLSRTIRC